jgi:hypothetical protein
MKNYLFIIAALISFNSFAQDAVILSSESSYETIGEVNWGPMYVADLTKFSDDTYTLSYQDAKYRTTTAIKEVDMSSSAVESLYETMMKVLPGTEDVTIVIGNKMLSVSSFKKKKSIMITILDEYEISSFFTLRAKDINKLFGK